MKLTPHPRLYITSEHYARLQTPPATPLLQQAAKAVTAMAREFLRDTEIVVDETHHNWHLLRARKMQMRIVTLLTEYRQSGDRRCRDMLLDDVRRMAGWEYWSWIAWRQNDPRPGAIFDLSYGENAATLAIAFDALHDELTDEEIRLFVDTARRRALQPYLQVNSAEKRPWWFGHAASNWNTVCNGGAGMLALAMGEICEESERVLELVEEGIAPFFESLSEDGAWPEGIGYWNYGMRYGFMYLLSHEQATGRVQPLLERRGTAATLLFPLIFSPNGVPCSFGDVNTFSPLPFHFRAAERLGRPDLIPELERRLEADTEKGIFGARLGSWPSTAEHLLLHPRGRRTKKASQWPRFALQQGLEWGYVADRMPNPNLYVAVRGGTIDAPHVHRDLLSYHCLVGSEKLIENIPVDDYMDTTFSSRRWELYETAAASKNTIFINGAGIADKSSVVTTCVHGTGYEGFRLDATEAMGTMRDGTAASFCGRLILLVKRRGVLVIDRIVLPHAGLVESRLHTFYPVSLSKMEASVRGKENRLHLAFASSQPALLKRGLGLQAHPPRKPDNIIRHLSSAKARSITLCQFLLPNGKSQIQLTEDGERTRLVVEGDLQFKLNFATASLDSLTR